MTFKMPVCNRVEPHEQHGAPLPDGGEWLCFGKGNLSKAGLNPQEIRLRLAESLLAGGGEVDEGALDLLNTFAVWAEHGPDETPQLREWAAACSDPSLHEDGAIMRVVALEATAQAQIADLKTELLEAHADLEASRAREQIAQQGADEMARRAAEVLAWATCQCQPEWTERGMHASNCREEEIRAILVGDQGEEACDCHDANGNLTLDVDEEARADG